MKLGLVLFLLAATAASRPASTSTYMTRYRPDWAWKINICAGIDKQLDNLRMPHLHGYLYDPSTGEVGCYCPVSVFVFISTVVAVTARPWYTILESPCQVATRPEPRYLV